MRASIASWPEQPSASHGRPVAPKRGERVAPPARAGEWTLVFGEKAAADGWEELCRQAPGNTREAWDSISRNPRDRTKNQTGR
jgi:hypothetical protein